MMRVPLGISRRAKQPLPCTFERRTSSHLLGGRTTGLVLTFNLAVAFTTAFFCAFFFAFAMIRLQPWP